jgi:hypothetical protein
MNDYMSYGDALCEVDSLRKKNTRLLDACKAMMWLHVAGTVEIPPEMLYEYMEQDSVKMDPLLNQLREAILKAEDRE